MSQTNILKTLSEIITQRRQELKISQEEIARTLKVPLRYVTYLENNELKRLPAPVYTKGLLTKYSAILGLESARVLKLYEYEIAGLLYEETNTQATVSPSVRMVITPQKMLFFMTVLLVAGVAIYWSKQVSTFFSKPELAIISPSENLNVERNYVVVEGKTKEGNTVDINNQPVAVSDNGSFQQKINLQPGLNLFTITTEDQYGKRNSVTRKVSFEEEGKSELGNKELDISQLTARAKNDKIANQTGLDQNNYVLEEDENIETRNSGDSFLEKKGTIILKLRNQSGSSWINIISNEQSLYSGILLPGITKTFSVAEGARINVNRFDDTVIEVNDQEFKFTGNKYEQSKEFIVDSGGIREI